MTCRPARHIRSGAVEVNVIKGAVVFAVDAHKYIVDVSLFYNDTIARQSNS